jgi:hypothetical protein
LTLVPRTPCGKDTSPISQTDLYCPGLSYSILRISIFPVSISLPCIGFFVSGLISNLGKVFSSNRHSCTEEGGSCARWPLHLIVTYLLVPCIHSMHQSLNAIRSLLSPSYRRSCSGRLKLTSVILCSIWHLAEILVRLKCPCSDLCHPSAVLLIQHAFPYSAFDSRCQTAFHRPPSQARKPSRIKPRISEPIAQSLLPWSTSVVHTSASSASDMSSRNGTGASDAGS